jgi:putative membrane protein
MHELGDHAMRTVMMSAMALLTLGAGVTWAQGAGPTDPQIAAIVVTANKPHITHHDTEEIAVMLPRTKYFKVMGIPIS